jgi:ABC-2 type transport system ATP-binding protein
MRDFIRALNRDRRLTVVLTTHDMDDIEALCNRLLVISSGRIVADGTVADLRKRISRERRVVVELEDEVEEFSDPEARVVSRDRHRLVLAFDPHRCSPTELVQRIMSRYRLRDLYVENLPIEEIVAELYAEAER